MGMCTACGCLLIAKVRFANATCPEGKWGEVSGVGQPYDGIGEQNA
jgi:hypothetical protein